MHLLKISFILKISKILLTISYGLHLCKTLGNCCYISPYQLIFFALFVFNCIQIIPPFLIKLLGYFFIIIFWQALFSNVVMYEKVIIQVIIIIIINNQLKISFFLFPPLSLIFNDQPPASFWSSYFVLLPAAHVFTFPSLPLVFSNRILLVPRILLRILCVSKSLCVCLPTTCGFESGEASVSYNKKKICSIIL